MDTKPSKYEIFHWRAVNFVGRLFGYGLVIASIVFASEKILNTEFGAVIDDGKLDFIFHFMVYIALFILGIIFIRVNPYYPEQYREWFESNMKKNMDDNDLPPPV